MGCDVTGAAQEWEVQSLIRFPRVKERIMTSKETGPNRLSRIAAKGLPLDPNQHQAMLEVPSNDAEPGTIVQELQAGYMIKDRLLRPAMVAVAKKHQLCSRPESTSRSCRWSPRPRPPRASSASLRDAQRSSTLAIAK